MNKFIAFTILFLSTISLGSEPKFHYMDCVKIVDGFYKNCKGRVTGFFDGGVYSNAGYYEVYLNSCGTSSAKTTDRFTEKELQSTKGCE